MPSIPRPGRKTLRRYLERNPIHFHELSRDEFVSWLEEQISRRDNDPVFQIRCKIRNARQEHFPRWAELMKEEKEAFEAWKESDHYDEVQSAKRRLEGAEKAISGLTASIEQSSGKEAESRRAKVDEFHSKKANLEGRMKELDEVEEKVRWETARRNLDEFRERVGIVQWEKELEEANRNQGKKSSKAGGKFEDVVETVVRDVIKPPLFRSLQKRVDPPREDDLHLLSGVTLGCAKAELDYLLIIGGDGKDSPSEVVAMIEVKRNPNDIAGGFLTRQENLAWFGGDRSGYDTDEYRTNVYTKGHFDRPACHQQHDREYWFDQTSFRRFRRSSEKNYYLDYLYFITTRRRLHGLRSGELSRLLYRVSTDVHFDLDDAEYVDDLYRWAREEAVSSFQTRDVMDIYLERPLWARQFVLVPPKG